MTSTRETPRTCDASGMIDIHRMFRRSFAETPALVRSVPDGDRDRTAAVVGHVRLIATLLDAHHRGEDERLWDLVGTRAPACALHVERMRGQHAVVHERLAGLDPLLDRWAASAATTDADPVAEGLDAVVAALAEHLPDEERTIVPVMEHTLTPRENAWFDRHGRASTPPGQMWNVVGLIVAAQPDGDAWVRRNLPAPVRLLWRTVGRRRYAGYRASLTGAAG